MENAFDQNNQRPQINPQRRNYLQELKIFGLCTLTATTLYLTKKIESSNIETPLNLLEQTISNYKTPQPTTKSYNTTTNLDTLLINNHEIKTELNKTNKEYETQNQQTQTPYSFRKPIISGTTKFMLRR